MRTKLAHIPRAARDVTNDSRILVIERQVILATFDEDALPQEATLSIEADIAFFDDPEERKSELVDGAIAGLSVFHDEFGIYGQGVSLATATLSTGWVDRLTSCDDPEAGERATPSASSPTTSWSRSWSPDERKTAGSPGPSSMPV